MKTNLLIFGTKNFNNTLDEIKDDLGFSFTYHNKNTIFDASFSSVSAVIVEHKVCKDSDTLSYINQILDIPVLLLASSNLLPKCKYTDKINLPTSFSDLQNKILILITGHKFSKNSSILIKKYILDKNEKKLKNNKLFIALTEREVQLIELLFTEKKPLSKNIILKKIWRYADDADTHTVETHIYRLRKKILDKFSDEKFIANSKLGYSI
jgi:hypothetical protein